MKKTVKVVSIIILLILTIFVLSNQSIATNGFDWKGKANTISGSKVSAGTKNSVENVLGSMITIVQIVGVGIAVIMLIVIAMKYMISAPGDRADIKKHAVVYMVGAVILFAAAGILEIIARFAEGI